MSDERMQPSLPVGAALISLFVLFGCRTPEPEAFRALKRRPWIHDGYEMRLTEAPVPEVVGAPPLDLEAPLVVRCGEVVALSMVGEPLVDIQHRGRHARVYWTTSRPVRRDGRRALASWLFVEGRAAGADTLRVLPRGADALKAQKIEVVCDEPNL